MNAKSSKSDLSEGKNEDPDSYNLGSFISISVRIMEKIFLDAITRYVLVVEYQNKIAKARSKSGKLKLFRNYLANMSKDSSH